MTDKVKLDAAAKALSCKHYEVRAGLEDAWWGSRRHRHVHFWTEVARGRIAEPVPGGRHWNEVRKGFEA